MCVELVMNADLVAVVWMYRSPRFLAMPVWSLVVYFVVASLAPIHVPFCAVVYLGYGRVNLETLVSLCEKVVSINELCMFFW